MSEERAEEMRKSWTEMEEQVELEMVEDEELEQDEEDREVEKILEKGKEMKRKLATSIYRFCVKHVKQCKVQYMC